ncbi:MAG: aldo/keto reductase [Bacteroidota bacterium]
MRYRRLGSTELEVSTVGFGAWAIGGNQWGPVDDRDSEDAILRALDLGITFFDTADVYGFGHSEEVVGRALLKHRGKIVLATKGGLRWDATGRVWRDASAAYLTQAVEDSLRRLKTDFIDLYQIHWPDPKTPQAETMECLQKLVDQGKIRYVGVSNYSVDQLTEAAQTRRVDALQPVYHLLDRSAEKDLFPYCASQHIGVVVYGPMAHGMLAGRIDEHTTFSDNDWRSTSPEFTGEGLRRNVAVAKEVSRLAAELGKGPNQLATAWVLANPAVHVAIVGAKNSRQVEGNVGGDFEVPAEYLEKLDRLVSDRQWADAPFPKP